MITAKASWLLSSGTLVVTAIAIVTGQQSTGSGTFTADQAERGRAAYQANCAGCHQADLGGNNEAPQLAGSNFMAAWSSRTSGDLLTRIRTSMPPGNPGSAGDVENLNIVAYLLRANGIPAGP